MSSYPNSKMDAFSQAISMLAKWTPSCLEKRLSLAVANALKQVHYDLYIVSELNTKLLSRI